MNAKNFVKFLIFHGVVRFGDFTLNNGQKSNIFFDFGKNYYI